MRKECHLVEGSYAVRRLITDELNQVPNQYQYLIDQIKGIKKHDRNDEMVTPQWTVPMGKRPTDQFERDHTSLVKPQLYPLFLLVAKVCTILYPQVLLSEALHIHFHPNNEIIAMFSPKLQKIMKKIHSSVLDLICTTRCATMEDMICVILDVFESDSLFCSDINDHNVVLFAIFTVLLQLPQNDPYIRPYFTHILPSFSTRPLTDFELEEATEQWVIRGKMSPGDVVKVEEKNGQNGQKGQNGQNGQKSGSNCHPKGSQKFLGGSNRLGGSTNDGPLGLYSTKIDVEAEMRGLSAAYDDWCVAENDLDEMVMLTLTDTTHLTHPQEYPSPDYLTRVDGKSIRRAEQPLGIMDDEFVGLVIKCCSNLITFPHHLGKNHEIFHLHYSALITTIESLSVYERIQHLHLIDVMRELIDTDEVKQWFRIPQEVTSDQILNHDLKDSLKTATTTIPAITIGRLVMFCYRYHYYHLDHVKYSVFSYLLSFSDIRNTDIIYSLLTHTHSFELNSIPLHQSAGGNQYLLSTLIDRKYPQDVLIRVLQNAGGLDQAGRNGESGVGGLNFDQEDSAGLTILDHCILAQTHLYAIDFVAEVIARTNCRYLRRYVDSHIEKMYKMVMKDNRIVVVNRFDLDFYSKVQYEYQDWINRKVGVRSIECDVGDGDGEVIDEWRYDNYITLYLNCLSFDQDPISPFLHLLLEKYLFDHEEFDRDLDGKCFESKIYNRERVFAPYLTTTEVISLLIEHNFISYTSLVTVKFAAANCKTTLNGQTFLIQLLEQFFEKFLVQSQKPTNASPKNGKGSTTSSSSPDTTLLPRQAQQITCPSKLSHQCGPSQRNETLQLTQFDVIFAIYQTISNNFAPALVSQIITKWLHPDYLYHLYYFYQLPQVTMDELHPQLGSNPEAPTTTLAQIDSNNTQNSSQNVQNSDQTVRNSSQNLRKFDYNYHQVIDIHLDSKLGNPLTLSHAIIYTKPYFTERSTGYVPQIDFYAEDQQWKSVPNVHQVSTSLILDHYHQLQNTGKNTKTTFSDQPTPINYPYLMNESFIDKTDEQIPAPMGHLDTFQQFSTQIFTELYRRTSPRLTDEEECSKHGLDPVVHNVSTTLVDLVLATPNYVSYLSILNKHAHLSSFIPLNALTPSIRFIGTTYLSTLIGLFHRDYKTYLESYNNFAFKNRIPANINFLTLNPLFTANNNTSITTFTTLLEEIIPLIGNNTSIQSRSRGGLVNIINPIEQTHSINNIDLIGLSVPSWLLHLHYSYPDIIPISLFHLAGFHGSDPELPMPFPPTQAASWFANQNHGKTNYKIPHTLNKNLSYYPGERPQIPNTVKSSGNINPPQNAPNRFCTPTHLKEFQVMPSLLHYMLFEATWQHHSFLPFLVSKYEDFDADKGQMGQKKKLVEQQSTPSLVAFHNKDIDCFVNYQRGVMRPMEYFDEAGNLVILDTPSNPVRIKLIDLQSTRPHSHHVEKIITPFLNQKKKPNPNALTPSNSVLEHLERTFKSPSTIYPEGKHFQQDFGFHSLHILLSGGHPPLELFDLLMQHGMSLVYQYSATPAWLVGTEMGLDWVSATYPKYLPQLFSALNDKEQVPNLTLALRQAYEDIQTVPVYYNFLSYAISQPVRPVSREILEKLISLGHQYPVTQTLIPQLTDDHLLNLSIFPTRDYGPSLSLNPPPGWNWSQWNKNRFTDWSCGSRKTFDTKNTQNPVKNGAKNSKNQHDNTTKSAPNTRFNASGTPITTDFNSIVDIIPPPSKDHQKFLQHADGLIEKKCLIFPTPTSTTSYPTVPVHPLNLRGYDILTHHQLRSGGNYTYMCQTRGFKEHYWNLATLTQPFPPIIKYASYGQLTQHVSNCDLLTACFHDVFHLSDVPQNQRRWNDPKTRVVNSIVPSPWLPSPFTDMFKYFPTKGSVSSSNRVKINYRAFPLSHMNWIFEGRLPVKTVSCDFRHTSLTRENWTLPGAAIFPLCNVYATLLSHNSFLKPFYLQSKMTARNERRVKNVLSKINLKGDNQQPAKSQSKSKDITKKDHNLISQHNSPSTSKISPQHQAMASIIPNAIAKEAGKGGKSAKGIDRRNVDQYEMVLNSNHGSGFASVPKDFDHDDDDDDAFDNDDFDDIYFDLHDQSDYDNQGHGYENNEGEVGYWYYSGEGEIDDACKTVEQNE